MNKSHGPLIVAIVLLLTPILYLACYCALVDPMTIRVTPGGIAETVNYRGGGIYVQTLFWPLEQIDRQLRPGTWAGDLFLEVEIARPRFPPDREQP